MIKFFNSESINPQKKKNNGNQYFYVAFTPFNYFVTQNIVPFL